MRSCYLFSAPSSQMNNENQTNENSQAYNGHDSEVAHRSSQFKLTCPSPSQDDTIATKDLPHTEDWPVPPPSAAYENEDFPDTIPTQDLPQTEDWDQLDSSHRAHLSLLAKRTTQSGGHNSPPQRQPESPPLETSQSTIPTQDLPGTEDWEALRPQLNYENQYHAERPSQTSQMTIPTQDLPNTDDWNCIEMVKHTILKLPSSDEVVAENDDDDSEATCLTVPLKSDTNNNSSMPAKSSFNDADSPTLTIVSTRQRFDKDTAVSTSQPHKTDDDTSTSTVLYQPAKHSNISGTNIETLDEEDSTTSTILIPTSTNAPSMPASPLHDQVVSVRKSIPQPSNTSTNSRHLLASPLSTGTISTLDSPSPLPQQKRRKKVKQTPWFQTKRRNKLKQTTLKFG